MMIKKLFLLMAIVCGMAQAGDALDDVCKPRPYLVPSHVQTQHYQIDTEGQGLCEKCYVRCSCCGWGVLWNVVRCCCCCFSLGAGDGESCEICNCCDCADDSTRTREDTRRQVDTSRVEEPSGNVSPLAVQRACEYLSKERTEEEADTYLDGERGRGLRICGALQLMENDSIGMAAAVARLYTNCQPPQLFLMGDQTSYV